MIVVALVLTLVALVVMVLGLRSGVYSGGTRRQRMPYAVPSIACLLFAAVLLLMAAF